MQTHQFKKYSFALAATTALLLTLGLALFWRIATATAQDAPKPIWSMDAMACVPNGSTTENNLVQTSHGHARYTEGKTGDLYLICPFTDASLHGTVVQRIDLTFRGEKVSAGLRMIDKQTGDVYDALQVSDRNCLTDTSQFGNPYLTCIGANNSAHVLDFQRYYYYVQLSLNRTNPATDVRVVGVSIW